MSNVIFFLHMNHQYYAIGNNAVPLNPCIGLVVSVVELAVGRVFSTKKKTRMTSAPSMLSTEIPDTKKKKNINLHIQIGMKAHTLGVSTCFWLHFSTLSRTVVHHLVSTT